MNTKAIWLGAVAVMAVACPALGQSPPGDVPPGHWASGAVKALQSRGIITGYPNGTFGGQRAITRYEFATAAQRTLQEAQSRIDRELPATARHTSAPGVTQEEVNQRLQTLATRAEVDQLHAEIDELHRTLSQFQTRAATLRSEVDLMRQQVGDLNTRVSDARSEPPLKIRR
jgi:polyhydroxyalkanoate synthesis regulator phasin